MLFQAVDTIYKMAVKALWALVLIVFYWWGFQAGKALFWWFKTYQYLKDVWVRNAVEWCSCFCRYFIQCISMVPLNGDGCIGDAGRHALDTLSITGFLCLMPDEFLCLVMAVLRAFNTIYQFTVKAFCSVALMLFCWYGLMMVSVLFQ